MNNKVEQGKWGIRKELIESRDRNLEALQSLFSAKSFYCHIQNPFCIYFLFSWM